MKFSKYVGAGNDFIFIDNRDFIFPAQDPLFIRKLCHRQCGIGADGVILLENSSKADYKMRIFNSDGHEAEMCGNGSRCFYKFIHECTALQKDAYVIETKESCIKLAQDGSNIQVSMMSPCDIIWNMDLKLDSSNLKVHSLNTGVPHAVVFLDEIKDSDLKNLAPKIRYHESFSKGTNVNFVKILSNNEIMVRTYERGVEDETLSCGTGVTASAIAAAYLLQIPLPIKVNTKSNEQIEINCTINKESIQDVTMSGPAELVYKGEFVAAEFNNLRKS